MISLQNEKTSVQPGTPHAVIVIAGTVNYYYDDIGRRVGEALRNLGFAVDVCTLRTYREADYDWAFFMPMLEVCVAYSTVEEAMEHVAVIVNRAKHTANVLLECVQTKWFATSYKYFQQARLETLFDLGLHDQSAYLPPGAQAVYRFAYNGPTRREQEAAHRMLNAPLERPIPWTFVGHMQSNRVRLVQRLMEQIDKNGFVYLPDLSFVTEDGPHLNGRQLQTALEHSRYFIWCTHHDYFYMESERFRNALLSGSVPIKIMQKTFALGPEIPFQYLLMTENDFDQRIPALDFESVRGRFVDEFLALPSLEQELTKLIDAVAVHA